MNEGQPPQVRTQRVRDLLSRGRSGALATCLLNQGLTYAAPQTATN
jgi:hypothetical protein